MQRRITLLRHGHADEHPDDFSRPLSDAGRAAALHAGRALERAGCAPSLVITSAAPRALATAELVARACNYEGPIQVERGLYLASDTRCLAMLRRAPASAASVLLVGHNPGLSRLARDLCQSPDDLAPADYVSVDLELEDWAEL
jgi:phosphohistidine phosphatase